MMGYPEYGTPTWMLFRAKGHLYQLLLEKDPDDMTDAEDCIIEALANDDEIQEIFKRALGPHRKGQEGK